MSRRRQTPAQLSVPTALSMNLLSIACWAVSLVLIRYVKGFFPVSFQNFFRYLIALTMLWGFVVISQTPKQIRQALRKLTGTGYRIIIIAVCIYFHQYFLVAAVYLIFPGITSLITESVIIFSVLLAVIFLPDERLILKDPFFYVGLVVALIGLFLTATGGKNFSQVEFGRGSFYVLLSAFAWAVFSVLIKKWIPDVPASITTAGLFTIITPLFFITFTLNSGGFAWPAAPLPVWAVLCLSGLIGIGAGYTLYNRSLPVVGVTLALSLSLMLPLLTAIISFFVFGERLLSVQMIGGILLLLGCYLIIRVRFRVI